MLCGDKGKGNTLYLQVDSSLMEKNSEHVRKQHDECFVQFAVETHEREAHSSLRLVSKNEN